MFSLTLLGNLLLFLALVVVFIITGILYYRRTNPPVSVTLRRLLSIMRALTLVIILFTLFEPLLTVHWDRIQKPIIAILTDTSGSMALTDAKFDRSLVTKRILEQPFLRGKSNDYELIFYQFSDELREWDGDSLEFRDDGTHIARALLELKEKMADNYLGAVVLISDGNYNLGENPVRIAEEYNIPIFPIAIGDPTEQKDIVVSKISTNQITYARHIVPVDVTIKANGYKGKKVSLELKKDGAVIDAKLAELSDNAMETTIRLQYTPETPGYHKYTIRLPSLADELTTLNNIKNFYVKVLKDKIKVLLIAGSPGFDLSFMKRILAGDPNIDATCRVLKSESQFYEGPFPTEKTELNTYDCFIFLNFPRTQASPVISSVLNLMESENKPLLIIAGNDIDYRALKPMQKYLPFHPDVVKTNEQLVSIELTPAGMDHPLMRISDNEAENQGKWSELPPIYYSIGKMGLLPGSQSLLAVNKTQSRLFNANDELPIIATRKINQQKSMAILGHGIWRWDFLMQGFGKSNAFFQQFMSNCIKWLITGEDTKLVRIIADKEIYRNREKITFSAETYYEDYRPLSDADVQVMVRGNGREYEVLLKSTGDGRYEGEFQVLGGGDYTYQGRAFRGNRQLGEDTGRFSVEEFSQEFLETKMNEDLLEQIALNSQGKYFTPETVSDLENELHFPMRKIRESRQWEIWNRWSLLIAVIALLSVEWFIRKKKGML